MAWINLAAALCAVMMLCVYTRRSVEITIPLAASLAMPVLLALAAGLMLAVPAAADSGPEPALAIRVANAPDRLYYLDILERDEEGMDLFDSLSWSYDHPEELDQELLSVLEEAVPEGWHACTVQGTAHGPMWGHLTPEDGIHTFTYVGVPEEFRVLMVTAEGEVFLSSAYTRRLLQDGLTLDWGADHPAAASGPGVARPVPLHPAANPGDRGPAAGGFRLLLPPEFPGVPGRQRSDPAGLYRRHVPAGPPHPPDAAL